MAFLDTARSRLPWRLAGLPDLSRPWPAGPRGMNADAVFLHRLTGQSNRRQQMKRLLPIPSQTVTSLNRMQSRFSISKMRDDGSLQLFAGADSLESAKEQVEDLGELWPGTYVILNQGTKESFTINIGGDTKLH